MFLFRYLRSTLCLMSKNIQGWIINTIGSGKENMVFSILSFLPLLRRQISPDWDSTTSISSKPKYWIYNKLLSNNVVLPVLCSNCNGKWSILLIPGTSCGHIIDNGIAEFVSRKTYILLLSLLSFSAVILIGMRIVDLSRIFSIWISFIQMFLLPFSSVTWQVCKNAFIPHWKRNMLK